MSQNRKRRNSNELEDNVKKPKNKSRPTLKRPQPADVEIEIETIKPKRVNRRFTKEDEEEEKQLSKILFSGSENFLKCLEDVDSETLSPSSASTPDSGLGEEEIQLEVSKNKPAWIDEDDDGIDVGTASKMKNRVFPDAGVSTKKNQYKNLLEKNFVSLVGKPKWASANSARQCTSDNSDDDLDEETVRTCGFLKKTFKQNLANGFLDFKKVKNLNQSTKCEGIINCIEFHQKSTVALVAGTSGVASLFAVDGESNHKLHSVAFEKYPIRSAAFTKDGNEAVFGSNRSFYYSYDLLAAKSSRSPLPHGLTNMKKFVTSPDNKYLAVAGKWGEVHLLSSLAKERLCVLKQDSTATALIFDQSGNVLYGHSDTGEVTVWDMRTMRLRHKWIDVGCLQGTSLGISSSNQFLAAGSMQGVVNLYGVDDVLSNKMPKPRKSIFNLTTSIKDLKFNSSSEILALSSQEIDNAIRLFHVGTGTIFKNFPTFGTKMQQVTVSNFSPNSGYFAVGNSSGIVKLYRLKHFKSY